MVLPAADYHFQYPLFIQAKGLFALFTLLLHTHTSTVNVRTLVMLLLVFSSSDGKGTWKAEWGDRVDEEVVPPPFSSDLVCLSSFKLLMNGPVIEKSPRKRMLQFYEPRPKRLEERAKFPGYVWPNSSWTSFGWESFALRRNDDNDN